MLVRVLLLGLVVLVGSTSPARATGPIYYPPGGGAESFVYDVRDYGALCNDSADDTAEIQAAIDAAEATGKGGVIELPIGICIVTALNMNEPGLTLRGQTAGTSNNSTVLSCNITTGTCLTFDTSCTYCGVEDMIIATRAAPTSTVLVDGSLATNTFARDINLTSERYCTGFKNVYNLERISLQSPVAGAACRGVSAVDTRLIMSNVIGSIGANIEGMVVIEQTGAGQVDTVVMTDVEIAQGGAFTGAALKIMGTSSVNPPRWIQISNSLFEARTTGAAAGDYPIHLTNVRDFKCTNCYAQGGYRGVMISGGPGPITFANSVIGNTMREGIYHDADVVTTLIGTTVSDAGGETDNTYSDVYLSANSRNFTMIGGVVGSEALGFASNDPKYGIEVIAGADKYRFSDVVCTETFDTSCAVGLTPAAAQVALTDALALGDADWSNYVTLRAPGTVSANYTLILPTTDGAANDLLYTSDGSGTMAWRTPNAGTDITADLEEDAHCSEHDSADVDCSGETIILAANSVDAANVAFNYAASGGEAGSATSINAASCTYGVTTDGSGVPACQTAPGTPEYTGRVMTVGGSTVDAYTMVQLDGTDDDEVIEATSSDVDMIGCSATGSSVTSGNTLVVQTAGIARCAVGTVVTGDLLKISSTSGTLDTAAATDKIVGRAITDTASGSAYVELWGMARGLIGFGDLATNVAWLAGRSGGQALIGGTGSGDDLTLTSTSHATKGTLFLNDHIELWDDFPDVTDAELVRVATWDPTIVLNGVGGVASEIIGVYFNPTINLSDAAGVAISDIKYIFGEGTIDHQNAGAAYAATTYLFDAEVINQASVAGGSPQAMNVFRAATTNRYTPATSSGTLSVLRGFWANNIVDTTGAGQLTVTAMTDFASAPNIKETAGTTIVTTLKGFDFAPGVTGSPTITTMVGLDIAALTQATTNIGIRNADTTVNTPATSTMSVVGSTISAGQTVTMLDNTSGGSLTLTAAPTIADGVNGQILYVFNGSTNNVVISDQGTLASSNLRLSATTITLGTRDSITLMYSTTIGDWIQIAQQNVL